MKLIPEDALVGLLIGTVACGILMLAGCSADVHVGNSVNDAPETTQVESVPPAVKEATCEMVTVVVGVRENPDYTVIEFQNDGTRAAREGSWGYRQDRFCVTRITRNNPTRINRNNAFYEKDMKLQMFDVTWR